GVSSPPGAASRTMTRASAMVGCGAREPALLTADAPGAEPLAVVLWHQGAAPTDRWAQSTHTWAKWCIIMTRNRSRCHTDARPVCVAQRSRAMVASPLPPPRAIEVFYAYAHPDAALRTELDTHLSLLRRQGIIAGWHDRRITAGTEWAGAIDAHRQCAQIILLLVSADFLASDYCYDVELQHAMARHQAGEARVIPIILRAVEWENAPFGTLQALPQDGRPITS